MTLSPCTHFNKRMTSRKNVWTLRHVCTNSQHISNSFLILGLLCFEMLDSQVTIQHSHKKRKDSLNQALFAAELDFPKILVPRLPQNSSNVNTECAVKSKQLYSLCEQLLGALIMTAVNYVIIGCSPSRKTPEFITGASHWRKSIVAVITQDRVIDDNLKKQIKNRTLHICRLFLLTRLFQYISNLSKAFEHFFPPTFSLI